MSTNVSNCQGRYVAYSQEVDKVFFANYQKIKSFKEQKVQEILKDISEDNSYFNLSCEHGIGLATKTISEETGEKITEFAQEKFFDLRRDIASSILSAVIMSSK